MNTSYTYEYQEIIKPSWAPPSWLFGPVWFFLYIIITSTFCYVFYKVINNEIPQKVALPFILNLIFNFSFSFFQFYLRNNLLSSIDIILILLTIVWMFIEIWPYSRAIVYLNIPYFIWVCFATILQLSITYLNFNK